MPSKRDEAFDAFYARLLDKGGIGGRDILRAAWEAGRQYEAERRIGLARASIEAYMRGDGEPTEDLFADFRRRTNFTRQTPVE